MTKYVRITRSKMDGVKNVLKLMVSLRETPSMKVLITGAKQAAAMLESIKDGSISEEPVTRLLPNQGLYFVIMKDRITHLEFADDRVRLPIFRSMRDATVAMERNGWTEEDHFTIQRIDLMKIKNHRFSAAMIAKYKQAANENEDDISGDQ